MFFLLILCFCHLSLDVMLLSFNTFQVLVFLRALFCLLQAFLSTQCCSPPLLLGRWPTAVHPADLNACLKDADSIYWPSEGSLLVNPNFHFHFFISSDYEWTMKHVVKCKTYLKTEEWPCLAWKQSTLQQLQIMLARLQLASKKCSVNFTLHRQRI